MYPTGFIFTATAVRSDADFFGKLFLFFYFTDKHKRTMSSYVVFRSITRENIIKIFAVVPGPFRCKYYVRASDACTGILCNKIMYRQSYYFPVIYSKK